MATCMSAPRAGADVRDFRKDLSVGSKTTEDIHLGFRFLAEPPVLPQQREAEPFGERDPRRPDLSVHFGTEKS